MLAAVALIVSAALSSASVPRSSLTAAPAPKNGEELIRAMHERYAGKWYSTLTFVQKTTYPDGRIETWYESLKIPGSLRIDIAPLDSGKAILFRADSIWLMKGGKAAPGQPLIHPLMVLGFDVYADPVEKTLAKLRALKIDLSKLHADTWQGKAVYVVGASPGDDHTAQFWVDQETLLFVRLVRPTDQGGVNESQFNKYVRIGDAWLSPEVLFFVNGKPGNKEEYSDWKTNVPLAPNLFDPARSAPAEWIKTKGS